jgi:putative copper export protein
MPVPAAGRAECTAVVSVSWETLRISLHILAATVWVGGQITLGALVPTLRGISAEAPGLVARRFNRIAWAAYAVLVLTGGWNIAAEGDEAGTAWRVTLWVKIAVVAASGLAAWLHTRARGRGAVAAFGALSALTAVAAVVLGVVLRG